MTEQEEIITRWEKAQIAYDVWFETLPLKHRTGETIYTQLKDVWNHAALDVKKINSLASEQLTAAEARIKELESQMADSLKLYECQNNAVIKRDERIKELEEGLLRLHRGNLSDTEAVDNYIDQLLNK